MSNPHKNFIAVVWISALNLIVINLNWFIFIYEIKLRYYYSSYIVVFDDKLHKLW